MQKSLNVRWVKTLKRNQKIIANPLLRLTPTWFADPSSPEDGQLHLWTLGHDGCQAQRIIQQGSEVSRPSCQPPRRRKQRLRRQWRVSCWEVFLNARFVRNEERFSHENQDDDRQFCSLLHLAVFLKLLLWHRWNRESTSCRVAGRRKQKKKMRRISHVNVTVINNVLQVLKTESMRIQQLPSNFPPFNLY